MKTKGSFWLLSLGAACFACEMRAQTRPDHVVIVIMENKTYASIIGNTSEAPHINALAAAGANFVNAPDDPTGERSGSHGLRHPSQPNYLELFSGDFQGVLQDGYPGSSEEPTSLAPPFNTPNLGASLVAAGLTFATYSEDMPSVGFDGESSGDYKRKHNPVANWQAGDAPANNHLPLSVNQPFTVFPTTAAGFAALPTISFVVPNQQHDMHDGTIAMADTWVKQNLIDTYLAWAQTHNSLLILTFDEDSFDDPTNPNPSQTTNQIVTIFAGPMIRPGNYFETDVNVNNPDVRPPNGFIVPTGTAMNHYNVLATLEDMYGLPHLGGSFNRRSITDVFRGPVFSGPLVVPNEWTAAQADTGNLFPLFSSKPIRYQQVFDADQFARLNNSGGLINRVAFRGHGPGVPFTGTIPQLQVNLSTTTKSKDALSSTFAQNVGANDTQVFSGPLQTAVTFNGDPANFEMVISFTKPFFYDPANGNLLLDVRNFQGGVEVPPNDQEIDGTLASNDSTSRVYNYGDVNAATAGQSGGVDEKDSYGLVTRFNTINVVSRKTHGTVGNFDIGLPLAGTRGIECRDGGASGNYQIVVSFATSVTFAGAQVTEGTGSVSGTATDGAQVLINLTGVANAQTIKVTLASVDDGFAVNDVAIPMSVLVGDANANGSVNATDVSQTKLQSGQPVTATNFREDVTANGAINSTDVSLVKAKSGTGLSQVNTSVPSRKAKRTVASSN